MRPNGIQHETSNGYDDSAPPTNSSGGSTQSSGGSNTQPSGSSNTSSGSSSPSSHSSGSSGASSSSTNRPNSSGSAANGGRPASSEPSRGSASSVDRSRSFNFPAALDNLEDLLIAVLGDHEQVAKEDVMALRDQIRKNNDLQRGVRELQNAVGDADKFEEILDRFPELRDGPIGEAFDGDDTDWTKMEKVLDNENKNLGDIGAEKSFDIQLAMNRLSRDTELRSAILKRSHDNAMAVIRNV